LRVKRKYLCILENHPLRPVQSGGRDPDLGLVFALASPTRWSNAKIVEKPVSFFNVEKRRLADHVHHAFHHNLTTKKPCPALPFLKKPRQKPRSTSNFPNRKNCSNPTEEDLPSSVGVAAISIVET
jgi:hypothetical protein